MSLFRLVKSHFFLLLVFQLLFTLPVLADDPGITKARIIQQSDSTFIMEIDIAERFLYTLRDPVFPEGFVLSDPEATSQSGWVTVRFTITAVEAQFTPEDRILLPWIRNGADVTFQWLDGSVYKGLFSRTFEGIVVPMERLMPSQRTTLEVFREGLLLGLDHAFFKGVYILLVLALFLFLAFNKAFQLVVYYFLGQAAALVLGELGVPGIDLLFVDLLLVVLIFLLAYFGFKGSFSNKGFALLFVGVGLLQTLSYFGEIPDPDLSSIQRVQSSFGFNLGLDLVILSVALLIYIVKRFTGNSGTAGPKTASLVGGLSVCLLLVLFSNNVIVGNNQVLSIEEANAGTITIPTPNATPQVQARRGAQAMNTPVMLYLSVEPYEIRQEILVQLGEALPLTGMVAASPIVPVEEQQALKTHLLDSVLQTNRLVMDGQELSVSEASVNFVLLNKAGVTIREEAVDESLEDGIIGMTLIYDMEGYPEKVDVDWGLFKDSGSLVEASAIDPSSSFTITLDRDNNVLNWENKLAGFKVPVISEVSVQKTAIPWLSIVLWLLALGFAINLSRKKQKGNWAPVISILFLGVVLYPFLRFDTGVSAVPQWKPSEERTAIIMDDILTNVFRAFDRRKEDDVYDRLDRNVTGEQLTEIYLQNRTAMALENRGGARANVDQVEVLEVFSRENTEQGLVVDALWTVNGSVNHFGHTHYRQNQYRAKVTLVIEEGSWKISEIETLDERRII